MKNIQVIDSADNCEYSLFAATDEEFALIFPGDTDVEFIEDFLDRLEETTAAEVLDKIWDRPVPKKEVQGIHGTLYYQLSYRKRYYPTKRESEMVPLGTD